MKKKLEYSNEDFIEEMNFDRKDMTAHEAVRNFSLIFFAISFLLFFIFLKTIDRNIDITKYSYINPLFILTIIYTILKSFFINLSGIIITMIFIFKGKTLYEGDEAIFGDLLILMAFIHTLFMGAFDYFVYTSLMHMAIIMGINICTLFILFPSLITDIKRLYLY